MAHWGTCVDSTHKGVLFVPWGNFFTAHKGVAFVSQTREGVLP